jgi:(p)ppGpp synthase/HD superfamily hydrolase
MATDTLIAALIHDYVYKTQSMTRQEADELFNEVMIVTEVNTFKRINYYL